MSNPTRIYKRNGIWFFKGGKFEGEHFNLYALLMQAKAKGE